MVPGRRVNTCRGHAAPSHGTFGPRPTGTTDLTEHAAGCDAEVMDATPGTETIERVAAATRAVVTDARYGPWRDFEPLPTLRPACCCCAKPVVKVVMPVTDPECDPTDLLLCGHHFRASVAALVAAGAVVFDASGALVRLPD